MDCGKIVYEVAWSRNILNLTDDNVEYILWEHTGFPGFWDGRDPEACLRRQVNEFFDECDKYRAQQAAEQPQISRSALFQEG